MSLRNPGDEYNELIPEGKGIAGKALKKSQLYIIVLIIGLIAGMFIQYYYLAPIISAGQTDVCKNTILTKEMLTTENECLYSLLAEPKKASEQCAARAFNEQQAPATTDSNLSPEAKAA